MEVKQVYQLVNDSTKEILGESSVLAEDLSNVVDIGTEIFNANAVDNYVRSLVNHIGKVIFVNRVYSGSVPSVLMDGWEYGSVLEKITAELPEATENESWELQYQTSYDPNIFYQPRCPLSFSIRRSLLKFLCPSPKSRSRKAFLTLPSLTRSFLCFIMPWKNPSPSRLIP